MPSFTAFLHGVDDALAWLLARENKARAIEILRAEMPALSAGNLDRVYEKLVDSRQGLVRNGVLDPRAAQTVLALRAKYAGSRRACRISTPTRHTLSRCGTDAEIKATLAWGSTRP